MTWSGRTFVRAFVVCLLLLAFETGWAQTGPATSAAKPANADAPAAASTSTLPGEPAVVPKASAAEPSSTPEMKAAPIRFGSGDLLDIRVFGVPELTTEVRISDFGQISFPLVGDVAIAGMTSDEAKAEIERKLRAGGFVNNPQVSIFPKEFATQGISVLGEVNKPGVFTMQGPRRMFDLLSAAGGTTPRAGRTVSITHRDDPDHPVEVELSRDPAKNLALKNNVQIYPGDTVVVSRAGVVYVVGEVAHPAGLVMENNERMSALQAYAMAGGATSTAKLSDSRVIRRTPTGLQEIRIPMKQMLEAKADDIPLQAEDILYIPGSPGKKAARRTMDSIISITTGLALRY